MRRRKFLISTSFALIPLSGCMGNDETTQNTATRTETPTATETPHHESGYTPSTPPTPADVSTPTSADNPWQETPIVVGVDRQVSGSRDFNQQIEEAISYWESNSDIYTAYEDVEFEYRPNSDHPHVVIHIVDRIPSCGEHDVDGQIAGCAPLLTENVTVENSESIRIIGKLEGRSLRHTLKHEFGHLLGLDHDDEPQEVMSYDPSLRIPDYEEKTEIVELYVAGIESWQEAGKLYNEGTEFYQDREYNSATEKYFGAADYAHDAATKFDDAESISITIGQSAVENICAEAVNKCLKAEQSYTQIGRAAEDYAAEYYEQGDSHLENHQTAHTEMRQLSIESTRVVRDELGLPS